MAQYTKRIQSMLTEEQFEALVEISRELDRPISLLVRDAVEEVYLAEAHRARRRTALGRLLSLDAPVADWETMEDEIARGAVE